MSSMTTKVQQGELGPFRPSQPLMFLKVGQPGQERHGFMLLQRKNIFLCKGNLCICLQCGMCEAPSLLHPLLQYLSSQQAVTASSSRTVFQLSHQQSPLPQAITEITRFKARVVKIVTLWKLFPQLRCFCMTPGCRQIQSLLPFCTRLEE